MQNSQRILSLDVVRGVALLGILLLNIVGMGMLSTAYFHPLGGSAGAATSLLDQRVWLFTEMFFEGSMRALFSMLFGAGVILFTSTKSGALHYRRTFWLLVFGLVDGYVLQWSGDILIVYALAGAVLYFARNAPVGRLIACALVLALLLGATRGLAVYGLGMGQAAQERVVATQMAGEIATKDDLELASAWEEFAAGAHLPVDAQEKELTARRASYTTSFLWNARKFTESLSFVLPMFMLWDALLMMLIGMALYRAGILQGERSSGFYLGTAVAGISAGLAINAFELHRVVASNYDVLLSYSYIQPSYDLGRLALGLGYMALIVWWVKQGYAQAVLKRLAAVGQMALTNYLMHSLIALVVFTGTGFALVGLLDRWQLYLVVFAIWAFQLWFSPWWLGRHHQGPLEALWRRLTYGRSRSGSIGV